ncbi:MAG: hypothetical protein AAF567_19890 [Actinomycetota bacterium]
MTTQWRRQLVRLTVLVVTALAMTVTVIIPSSPEAEAAGGPCPQWSVSAVLADSKGDWDGDRVTNGHELFHTATSPCDFDAFFCQTGSPYCTVPLPTVVYHPHYVYYPYTVCAGGVFTLADIGADPHGDWDRDGVSNLREVQAGTHPCVFNRHYVVHYVYVPRVTYHAPTPAPAARLPHVGGPTYHAPAPAPVINPCPTGYPHYHEGNGQCYANPVNTPAGW